MYIHTYIHALLFHLFDVKMYQMEYHDNIAVLIFGNFINPVDTSTVYIGITILKSWYYENVTQHFND